MIQLDEPTTSTHHDHLTCPNCGYTTVVQHGSVYTCLNCNFRRNVSEPDNSAVQAILLTLLAVVIGIWFGLAGSESARQPTNASGISDAQTALSAPLN